MTHPVKKIAQHGHPNTGRPRSAPFSLPNTLRAPKSEAKLALDLVKKFNTIGQARHTSIDSDLDCFRQQFPHQQSSEPPIGLYPNPPRLPPVTARKALATCDGLSQGTATRAGSPGNVAFFDGFFSFHAQEQGTQRTQGQGLSAPSAAPAQTLKALRHHGRQPKRINYHLKTMSLTCCHKNASMMIASLLNIASSLRILRG